MPPVVLTETHGPVLSITLNRPAARNAFDSRMAEGLTSVLRQFEEDRSLVAAVLRGSGSVFCAGMDLKEFADGVDNETFHQLLRRGSDKPLVAAIEGYAMAGGLELALLCDVIVAAKNSRLGLPEVGLGLFAAGGALLRLQRRVSFGRAMMLVLSGEAISGEEAHSIGLVDRLVDAGHAADEALALAGSIAKNAPLAVRVSKRLMLESFGRSEAEFWSSQESAIDTVFASNDAREGVAAFIERRRPQWGGD